MCFKLRWAGLIIGGLLAPLLSAAPPSIQPWTVTFEDDFEGSRLDDAKWTRSGHREGFVWNGAKGERREDHAEVDGEGNLVIKVTRDPDGTYGYHSGIHTKGKFHQTYGYFETRARFTRQPGWWGAVWLYGVDAGPNPFLMGQEIDLIEDFSKPKRKNDFAHNLHFDAQLDWAPEDLKRVGKLDGDTLSRVSRGTNVLVDDWDNFHVVGVHWTPLEYVFYCDGRETFRLDYRQVPVTTQPMHLLISGCFRDPARAQYQGDYADAQWPDQLTVDYIRVYQDDLRGKRVPKVALLWPNSSRYVRQDAQVTVRVLATDTDRAVTNLYLFSNGRIRAEKAAGSGDFTLPARQLYYGHNVLIAMARDLDGRVGMSEPVRLTVRGTNEGKGAPYRGQAQRIPGDLLPGHYDEGGPRVAYFTTGKENKFARAPWNLDFRPKEGIDSPGAHGIGAVANGMWVTYAIEVEQSGIYEITPSIARHPDQASAKESTDRIVLELDETPLTEFGFSSTLTTGAWWGKYRPLPSRKVHLPAGRHGLRVQFEGRPFQFGGLKFSLRGLHPMGN